MKLNKRVIDKGEVKKREAMSLKIWTSGPDDVWPVGVSAAAIGGGDQKWCGQGTTTSLGILFDRQNQDNDDVIPNRFCQWNLHR